MLPEYGAVHDEAIGHERRAQRTIRALQDRWPSFQVDVKRYIRYVDMRCKANGQDAAKIWEQIHHEDLYLAYAALSKDRAALRSFQRVLNDVSCSIGRTLNLDTISREDFLQKCLIRLLVAEPGRRRAWLENYSGRGALCWWLKTTVEREAVRFSKQTETRECSMEDEYTAFESMLLECRDPELLAIKTNCKGVFEEALREVFYCLSDSERELFRCRVERLSYKQTMARLGKSSTTVWRNFRGIQTKLRKSIRVRLSDTLKLNQSQVNSIIAAALSQFEANFSEILPERSQ